MSWLVTMLIGGMLLSIGWRLGNVIYEKIRDFIYDYPEGIRKIKRYQSRRNYRQTYITDEDRKRRLESR